MRTFRKGNGEGKVFHVGLLDADGGEIRASFFNEAVDTFFDKLQKGKCYTLSNGSVRIANRQFNQCNHRYELAFDKIGRIEECQDVAQIESFVLKLVDLRTVQSRPLPFFVDLCGVITSAAPLLSFTSRDGKELVKRELTIADSTATSMDITLWGDRAKQEDKAFEGNPVVVLKGVNVKEWNGGRSGSLLQSGHLLFDHAIPEVQQMKEWWSQGGKTVALTSLSGVAGERRGPSGKLLGDLAEMRREAEHVLDQPQIFTVVCRLAEVQMRKQGEAQPLFYMACMEPKEGNGWPCNRRVDASGFCAVCNRAGKAAPRMVVRCKFVDYSDSPWLTTFHEAAQKVVGLTAEQVKALEEGEGGREAAEHAFRKTYLQEPMQVTVRAKIDTYQGESRTNVTCISASPVARGDRGRVLLGEIKEMLAATAF